jgi:Na+/melibiose symporter-like transporter
MDEFLTIAIIGTLITFVVEKLKKKYGDENARFFTIVLSIVLGTIIWFLSQTPIWKTVLGCLASASLFYSYVLKVLE